MDAKVTWQGGLSFLGAADGGYPVKMDSDPSRQAGVSPMEMIALALAGCTAMDVISILIKKRQDVTDFEVKVHADRAVEHPKVFTKAVVEYLIGGHNVDEAAVVRAVELSVTRYCSVQAMLSKAFPVELKYEVYEEQGKRKRRLVKQGAWQPPSAI